jgi:hypothetical protein
VVGLEPKFYLNGEPLIDQGITPFGEVSIYHPDSSQLKGVLKKLSRCVVIGLRIPNFLDIVGGIHPVEADSSMFKFMLIL